MDAQFTVPANFLPLLEVFASEMTRPTFATLRTLLVGWLLAPRRTILGMVRASGTDRHHAAFHRVFAIARWSIDRVGLALFDLIVTTMPENATVFLVDDDTLLARRGLKVFGTGMHRDPVLSSKSHVTTRWGHSWVVLGVVIESKHVPDRHFVLPVLARLYLNTKSAAKWSRPYRKKTDLLLEMLQRLDEHTTASDDRRRRTLHFLGDSSYTAPAVLAQMPSGIEVTGRIVADARIHQPAPERTPGANGRPRLRGDRLPTPQQMLQKQKLPARTLAVYSNASYRMRIARVRGRLYRVPTREVLVIAAEHLTGGRQIEVFYTTAIMQPGRRSGSIPHCLDVLRRYSWRWPIEVTFRDVKQQLGIEQPQNRVTAAAERTAPTGMLLDSLVVWWHETVCDEPAESLRSWPDKRGASFADMLASLRLRMLRESEPEGFPTPAREPAVTKLIERLHRLIALAA